MRNRLIALMVAFWGMHGAMASADSPVVVELFTSQGCSSCPPADKILGELAQRDDVIALALHVDYWDYIGWKDQFADPAFTTRQRAYAHAAGSRRIYTPQMVVGGRDHVIGTKPMQLAEEIEKHRDAPSPVRVSLRRQGEHVTIRAKAEGGIPSGSTVQLVTYSPKEVVDVRRGENAGRRLAYHNIVRDWITVGTWNGSDDYAVRVKVTSDLPVAVLIQAPDAGAILGAAKLR